MLEDTEEGATSGGRVGGVVLIDTISFALLRTVVTVAPSARVTTLVTSLELELEEALVADDALAEADCEEEVAPPCVGVALATLELPALPKLTTLLIAVMSTTPSLKRWVFVSLKYLTKS